MAEGSLIIADPHLFAVSTFIVDPYRASDMASFSECQITYFERHNYILYSYNEVLCITFDSIVAKRFLKGQFTIVDSLKEF